MTIKYFDAYPGCLSPDGMIQNYPILKNASSFLTTNLESLGWKRSPITLHDDKIFFIVLRDPIKRWVSAVAEEFYDLSASLQKKILIDIDSNTNLFFDFLFELSLFDIGIHTKLQAKYTFVDIPFDKIVFFKHDENLNFKLHHWLLGEGIKNDFLTAKFVNVKKEDIITKK